jgi:prevent-host-death family protein
MESVGVRELRQRASALLDQVEASGMSIEITNHGHPVARLVPIPPQAGSSRAQMIDGGIIRPGRGNVLEVVPVLSPPGTPSSDQILAADRDER